MDDGAHRAEEPRRRERVDRVLRRPQRVTGRDRADPRRAHGQEQLRCPSREDWGHITKEMRAIYTAPTVEATEIRFAEFAVQWRDTYPAMISSRETAWTEFVPFHSSSSRSSSTRSCIRQRDRVVERAAPKSGPTSGALPERAGRAQGPLPRGDDSTQEP